MSDPLQTCFSIARSKRATGVAREHAYRPPLGCCLRPEACLSCLHEQEVRANG